MNNPIFMYFAMQNESLHGNPGNISVFKMLMDEQYAYPVDENLEKKFREKYPKYDKEPGWLWILYKNLSEKDIKKTVENLDALRK